MALRFLLVYKTRIVYKSEIPTLSVPLSRFNTIQHDEANLLDHSNICNHVSSI